MLNDYRQDIYALLKLAIPLAFSAVVQQSVAFLSTIFMAHLSITDIAASALVSRLFAALMIVVWGLLAAVGILIARAHGKNDNKAITLILRDGLLLAFFIANPVFLLLWNAAPILLWLGQPAEIVNLSIQYLHSLAWSIWPDFINLVFLQLLIGLGRVRAYMMFLFLAVPTNLIANYLLVFGKAGLPALGIAGLGWGTTLSYWVCTLGMFIFLITHHECKHYLKKTWQKGPLLYIASLLRLGLPMGAMYCLESAFFFTLLLCMGNISRHMLAANQVVLQYFGQIIAITFAIAQAVTISASHQLGNGNPHQADRIKYAGLHLALLFTGFIAIIYWLLPGLLIALDFNRHNPLNLPTIQAAKQILAVCALFQISEATRIIIYGALQALKDTHYPFLISIISFWGIALPVGYFFSTVVGWVGIGYWWGMVIGAFFSSILLMRRFNIKLKQEIDLQQKYAPAAL